ncbi:MAG: SUMF1/EgtB/PvdO family nonheme iron enzyme [Planctomycetes bacterium]|nr:SUMF1/EgtB/PvdO family nonheme iron enzyme [Planctomycetota bacterium]
MNGDHGNDAPPSGERLERGKLLLHDALQRPAEDAARWVRDQLGDDLGLADYVCRLLSASRRESDFGAVRAAAHDFVRQQRPERVGRYRIVDTLGEGGMGVVYLAEQTDPVRREVALKLVRLGMDSAAIVRRFAQERQALAMMQHDGIAKVHDCGTSERGQPFFVMELVRGTPLVRYCDERRLSLPRRLQLLQQVCDAVQHAHQKGVVHRDLKPSNVLVVEVDGRPQVKVIDFGLAKALSAEREAGVTMTEAGQILGTLEYMAPEQADPRIRDVDTRADVYSLGVMLYELLVGSLPFADTELRAVGTVELQRILRDVEPERPSRRFAGQDEGARRRLAAERGTTPALLLRALHRDLDWVVVTAMQKRRDERYESPSALAGDLQRFLDHEPLRVGPPSAAYRLRKFARRHRAQVVTAAVVFATAVVGAVVSTTFAFTAYALADEKQELAEAEAGARRAATENADLLADKVREFDLLSGVVLRERAVADAAMLYPAWPERVDEMEQWLDGDVTRLRELRPQIERTLRDLRERALPRTPELVERDRRSHPEWPLYEQTLAWVEALRRAAAVRRGGPLTIPPVPPRYAGFDVAALNRLVLARMSPRPDHRSVPGEEALAVALGQLAAQKSAGTTQEPESLDLLAWAWLACGDLEQARRCQLLAVERGEGAAREKSRVRVEELEKAIAIADEELAMWEQKLAELKAEVDRPRRFEFALESQLFLHDALVELVDQIEAMERHEVVEVEHRLGWARRIGELTLAHPDAPVTWADARAAIAASERYGGSIALADEDVVGLVPIGANPATGLWEFYHLASAWDGSSDPAELDVPRPRVDGGYDVDDDTGMIFVLVPGGTYLMGAQAVDPSGPNYEADAKWYVGPVNKVSLAPFLLGKYEVTQGQWARLMRGTERQRYPSQYRAGVFLPRAGTRITADHPVSAVDWNTCDLLLRQHGLELPTEAQWEYACRAGTTTPWFCAPSELRRYVNIADRSAKLAAAEWAGFEAWDDGHVVTAPVDEMLPNPWGFWHMAGNLLEWCRDPLCNYAWAPRPGDGLRSDPSVTDRVVRGGAMIDQAMFAKSSMRTPQAPTTAVGHIGVRASRSLTPRE